MPGHPTAWCRRAAAGGVRHGVGGGPAGVPGTSPDARSRRPGAARPLHREGQSDELDEDEPDEDEPDEDEPDVDGDAGVEDEPESLEPEDPDVEDAGVEDDEAARLSVR